MKLKFRHSYLLPVLLFSALTGIILVCSSSRDSIATSADISSAPVLIIDAGHGGADGGALAADGTKESVLNLEIAEKLQSLCGVFGINCLMTRDGEELSYPQECDSIAKMKRWDQHRRLDIINSGENMFFLSIHQNKFPDNRPYGPQVIYGLSGDSKAWGELCHSLLNDNLCPENRRLATPTNNDIYLMKNANCPAILAECGFMSNPHELNKLKNDDYQKKISAILLISYLKFSC